MNDQIASVSEYYDTVGESYRSWSSSLNIHFGYYRRGISPFDLEAMLAQMNEEVLNRLQIPIEKKVTVVDAGCGVGESLRFMARRLPNAHFYGVTISPWQVGFGEKTNLAKGFENQIEIVLADFQETSFPNGFADAVFAVESSVYADGVDKINLIKEMGRILKPGGRLVVVDGFRRGTRPFPWFFEKLYRRALAAWAITDLAEIGLFEKTLRQVGFENIVVEDIGWQVLPSAMHVPLAVLKLMGNLFRKNSRGSWRYLKALLLSSAMGIFQSRFGYFMIGATKTNNH
ncbi:MAG: methyltransferase domain-containing protein [Saprospiraceae bacterium]